MTCVVGLEVPGNGNKKGYVIIGSDSAASNSSIIHSTKLEKVFVIDKRFLIGYCGSFRFGQLLEHKLIVENQVDSQSDIEYLVTTFVDSLKKMLKDNGIERVDASGFQIGDDGSFLLGYNGKLYKVGVGYQVNRKMNGYDADGSGMYYALGSIYSSEHLRPKERIKLALKCASSLNPFVCKPFVIKRLKGVTNGTPQYLQHVLFCYKNR